MCFLEKNEWHQHVYLDDADDFYFWICEKIFTRKKVTSNQRFIPLLDIRCAARSKKEMQRSYKGGNSLYVDPLRDPFAFLDMI